MGEIVHFQKQYPDQIQDYMGGLFSGVKDLQGTQRLIFKGGLRGAYYSDLLILDLRWSILGPSLDYYLPILDQITSYHSFAGLVVVHAGPYHKVPLLTGPYH